MGLEPRNPPPLPLILKLRHFMQLTGRETQALESLGRNRRRVQAGAVLVPQGARARGVALLHSGWAIRHRTLRDGRRQIVDFVLPGDLCDPSIMFRRHSDYAVTTITPGEYSSVTADAILELIAQSPRLGAFFWWLEAQEEHFLRAHLVAVGRFSAFERIGYLLWELWSRLRTVGLAQDHTFDLPATQELIADATGLSHVHVSRTLSRMERDGLLRRVDHRYRILDPARLTEIAQVDETLDARRLPESIVAMLSKP